MIHKNLTPFFWGPKVTSRKPPQPEVAVCVRGVFKLEPGRPLEAIEDPIDQGFMSGELFAVEDLDQTGPITYPGDFADWKPYPEVLVKGSAYPPKGEDVTCTVGVGLGQWSKTLRVVGRRVFKPGVLFGGEASEPEPFQRMPLTWENAYGGEGYPDNPVGRGFVGHELPTVEEPGSAVSKAGVKGVTPATFLGISPHWPQRSSKRGVKYGKKWRATRYPFYSTDFDWSYFNTAPADQVLPGDLAGDEDLWFSNLHPTHSTWTTKLPGLRIRALVKRTDEKIYDLVMRLDTVYADTDAGRLYLTWRGHAPIQEIDMSDIGVVLIASEPLESEPLPGSHYEKLLGEFEDDPIGLKDAFPPGFLEVAQGIEAAELAELNGTPKPDLKALAASLPAACPFPPWFLSAAAGDPDPLGIQAKLPPSFSEEDPLKPILLEKGVPEAIADQGQREAALAKLEAKPDPGESLEGLKDVAPLLPPSEQAGFLESLQQAQDAIGKAESLPPEPPAPPPAAEKMASLKAEVLEIVAKNPEADATALAEAPSIDETVAELLAPLDKIQLPEVPDPSAVDAELAAESARLTAEEAALTERGVTSPLMGMFAFGQRLIDKMPRAGDVMPDMSPLIDSLSQVKQTLVAQGIGALALAPLTGLIARVSDLRDKVPLTPKPEARDHAYANLAGQDLSGQSFAGKSFACADLRRANLSGADLSGADLTETKLQGADLSGANLRGATLTRAQAQGANLGGADLRGSSAAGADFSGADLKGVNGAELSAQGAVFSEASLQSASLRGAVLIEAELEGTDLSGADLEGAKLESAKGTKAKLARANLNGSDLRFADFSKADLSEATLRGSDLSLAMFDKVRADGADFSGAKFDMAKITKSRLLGANFKGAQAEMAFLTGSNLTRAQLHEVQLTKCDLSECELKSADFAEGTLLGVILRDVNGPGARFVRADLSGTSVTGKSSFRDANFAGLAGRRSIWQDADLRDADFSYANLEQSYFTQANCEGANFFAAKLKGSSLMRARLVRTRFVSADLCGADLTNTEIVDTQFTLSNCYDVKFLGAKIASCDFLEANTTAAQFDPEYLERR